MGNAWLKLLSKGADPSLVENIFRKLLSSRRSEGADSGQIIPLTAILIFPLVIIAAFAIDIGSWYFQASEIQEAADLAALAGAELKGEGKSQAQIEQSITELIRRNGYDSLLDPELDIQFDFTTDVDNVGVTIRDADIQLYLAGLVLNDAAISRKAVATIGGCTTSCDQPITLSPPYTGLPETSDGDGTEPMIIDGGRKIITLNHHLHSNEFNQIRGTAPNNYPKQLVCVDVEPAGFCENFPRRVDTSTTEMTKLVWYEDRNEIWYLIQRPHYVNTTGATPNRPSPVGASTTIGLGCVNVEGAADCDIPFHRLGPDIPHSPLIQANKDSRSMATQPIEKDDKIYVIDEDMSVHCFDLVSRSQCWTATRPNDWTDVRNNDAVGNDPVTTPNPNGFEPTTEIIGDRMYGYWPTRNAGGVMICVRLSNGQSCPAFGTPTVSPSVYETTAIIESRNPGGQVNGVCAYGNFPLGCVRLNGNSLNRQDLDDLLPAQAPNIAAYNTVWPPRGFTKPIYHGTKMFIPVWAASETHCIDLATMTDCPNSPRTDFEPYAYDYAEGSDCILALGNLGKFSSFDANTMDDCKADSGSTRIEPCTCADLSLAWGAISFDPIFLIDFDTFIVTVTDHNGIPIPGLISIDLKQTGGHLDLSGLPDTAPFVTVHYEFELNENFEWTQPIEGSVQITERATLVE